MWGAIRHRARRTIDVRLMLALCAFLLVGHWPWAITQYQDLIETSARQYCIPADLLASVMWVESMGDANARGLFGEVGLMQILPNENEIAPAFFQSWSYPVEDLLRPAFNLDYGARRLRQVQRRTNSWLMTLAYFNCGEYLTDLGLCGKWGGYNYANKVISLWRQSLPTVEPVFDCLSTQMC